jgi:predicted ester cyclase
MGMVELCAPDCAFHGFAPQPLDREGVVQAMAALHSAFPDDRFPVDALVVEDDKAVNRHRMIATHTGAFQGIQPSGTQAEIQGMDVVHCAHGHIQAFWLSGDFLGLQQIGAIPQPQAAGF